MLGAVGRNVLMTAPDTGRLAWEARTSTTLAVLGTAFLVAYSVLVLLPDLEGRCCC